MEKKIIFNQWLCYPGSPFLPTTYLWQEPFCKYAEVGAMNINVDQMVDFYFNCYLRKAGSLE